MKFERFDDVIPSIKIDGKLFRLADNKDEKQIKLFNELLEQIFG